MTHLPRLLALACVLAAGSAATAADALHTRIDKLIDAGAKSKASPIVDDAGFIRRIYLDLAGTIPTAADVRKFLDDKSADKRLKLIDKLLADATYTRRMTELFHTMFMERMGDHPQWTAYLEKSFATNKPYDTMAREILSASGDEATRGASFFFSKRLENYGQNPVDYPGLARDVGRLFLGKDFQCAQCHDHLFIKEYKQADFQGLFVFIQSAYLVNAANLSVGEKLLGGKATFQSVFGKVKMEIGPRVPGRKEIAIPVFEKGKEYIKAPDRRKRTPGVPRFSPLAELAREVPASPDFSRNIVNRLWWVMMGRGLVNPLDQHHKDNPPSHPELLDVLAKEFVAHKYDIKWLLRELALTKTYQRSSELPEGVKKLDPTRFTTALERQLSAEQMLWSMMAATGEEDRITKSKATETKGKAVPSPLAQARAKFLKAFAAPRREPEDDLGPSLKGALFVLNDPLVLSWLTARSGNLLDRLVKMKDEQIAEELYLTILSRRPAEEERAAVGKLLTGKTGEARTKTLSQMAWALLASTEFAVNH